MDKREFFNLDPHQSVDSVLAGILIVVICLWIVVYYFHQGTNMVEAHIRGAQELTALVMGN